MSPLLKRIAKRLLCQYGWNHPDSYRKPQKGYVWLGVIKNDTIAAKKVSFASELAHEDLFSFYEKSWRAPEKGNTVFWWEAPTKEDTFLVETYLDRRGMNIINHERINKFQSMTHGEEPLARRFQR